MIGCMTNPDADGGNLRSAQWFGHADRDGFIHRSWMKRGWPDDAFSGKPMIGICNSWSELAPCNLHLDEIAEHVKRGVWEAGGVPVEFPAMALGESNIRPTAMLLRNLMSMAVEESIRANPIDGVVLLGGCDKNTPAQLMGAASVDLPTIVLSGGPMLNGKYKGGDVGSGTMVWRFSEDVKGGHMSTDDFLAAESCMTRSKGFCMTMGTASTMACIVEAMGLTLPYNGTTPAVDSRRLQLAHLTGRRAVEMVREDLRLSKVLTQSSFENAIRINAAIGGSTNAVVHLLAVAGRLGLPLQLSDFDRCGAGLPLLVDLQPSGRFLMEDFHYAGGLPAVMAELADRLDGDAMTVMGRPLSDYWAGAECYNREVIRTVDAAVLDDACIAVLKGNLCPGGAVLKPSAASPHLLKHRGRAVVFETIEDYKARIDDPDLDVDADSVLVLKGCGPKGYPGFPEVGNMALPPKLLAQGITDMVRISDARMSGTAYGAVVLHVSPEAAAGGPLAVVENGDWIDLDVAARTLQLDITDEELERRLAAWKPEEPVYDRGYYRLYIDAVNQAEHGADFDFLVGNSGSVVTRESH
jgi:dihydroxy-acid dehydratase